MPVDLSALQARVGNTESRKDRITAAALSGLAVTLGPHDPVPVRGSDAPPPSRWLHFNPTARQSDIGVVGAQSPGRARHAGDGGDRMKALDRITLVTSRRPASSTGALPC